MRIKNRLPYIGALLLLLAISIANGSWFATTLVHNHYINPQNKVYTKPVSEIRNIEWAYLRDDKVFVCVHGDIRANPAPGGGYISVSTFRQPGKAIPELVESDNTFQAYFSRQLLSHENGRKGNTQIIIRASSITPNCDEADITEKLPVFEIAGDLQSWLESNPQQQDFIYNQSLRPRSGFPRPWGSHYALVRDHLALYRFELIVETSIQRNRYDLQIGILLYPIAIAIDIATSPLQFILTHLPWG